jgi:hypothetical protein
MKLGRVFELKYDAKFEALKMALEGRSKENWKLKVGMTKEDFVAMWASAISKPTTFEEFSKG